MGGAQASACPAIDRNGDATVTIDELISAIAALIARLRAGSYLDWRAESAAHAGAGLHFGIVRAFVNDALFLSLSEGKAQYPAGAAAVK